MRRRSRGTSRPVAITEPAAAPRPGPRHAMIGRAGEAQLRRVRVVPHRVHIAVERARRIRVARHPLLVVAVAQVDRVRCAPGLPAVRRRVDHDPSGRQRHGRAQEPCEEEVATVVPRHRRVAQDREARQQLQRIGVVPRVTAVRRVGRGEREHVLLVVGEPFGRCDHARRIIRVDRDVRLRARVVRVRLVRDLDVRHGPTPPGCQSRLSTRLGGRVR